MRARWLLVPLLAMACLGLIVGCEAGSGEIPLAKVAPPPEGFGVSKAKLKMPRGASPADANSRRR